MKHHLKNLIIPVLLGALPAIGLAEKEDAKKEESGPQKAKTEAIAESKGKAQKKDEEPAKEEKVAAAKPAPENKKADKPAPHRGPGPSRMAEARERMRAHQQEIHKLMREGKHEQARKEMEEFHARVREIHGWARNRFQDGEAHDGKGHGEKHHRGRHHEERERDHKDRDHAGHRRHHPERGHHGERGGPEQKLHHLREAAEHLDAAGLHERAEQTRAEAEEIERDLHRQREREHRGPHPGAEHLERRLNAIEEAIEGLREQVEAIGNRLKERD